MSTKLAAASALVAFALAGSAAAKPSPEPAPRRSLRSIFGVDAVRPLLRADAGAVRERAFERLGVLGTPQALELLTRALETDGAARDARERLAVVRALAPHAADPAAEDALIRALGGVEGHLDDRALLVERTAALALAASHGADALNALARALRQPGRTSEHAALALRAYPPENVAPLLSASGAPTPALVTLLGELGDARAAKLVEEQATSGDAATRAAAVAGLFRLDRARGLAFARRAAGSETDPDVRAALARVLASSGDAGAVPVFAALLADPRGRSRALDLALDVENAAFGALLATAPLADDADRTFAALGHAGGTAALARLESALTRPADAWSALYALALSSDADAGAVIARALEKPTLRRDALRAAVVRAVTRGSRVDGTSSAVEALAHGTATDRAVAVWSRAALDPGSAATAFATREPQSLRALGRLALLPELARPAAERLARETDPELQTALAASLAQPGAADAVPTHVLVQLIDARGAAAYVAAFALALRDSETLRPRLRELLASDDPLLRAHVARGLGASAEASAVGLLGDTYRGEADASVRRAIVHALAERSEPGRRATLELAASLDPDDETRSLARAALAHTPTPPAPRHGTAWLRLTPSANEAPFAELEAPGGLALPLAADADGNVTVFGLAPGKLQIGLATATPGRVPHRGATP